MSSINAIWKWFISGIFIIASGYYVFTYIYPVGRKQLNIDSIYFYGDSITYGMGSSEGKDYATTVSDYYDLEKYNLSVSGQRLTNYENSKNFRDAVSQVVPLKNGKDSALIIALGTNDARFANPFSKNPAITPELYYTQFQECLDIIFKKGWLKSDIILITPFYDSDKDLKLYKTDRENYEMFVNQVIKIAKANNVAFFDAYNYMKVNGADKLISADNIHPNDNGYTVISNGLINVLNNK